MLSQNHFVNENDHYPFGMVMPGRSFGGDYRFGFNGAEKDDEIKGDGNSINFTARMYNPRLGRFLSVDPLTKEYPWYTPYQFAGNDVIRNIDIEGMQPVNPAKPGENKNGVYTTAIDNARAGFTPQYHLDKSNLTPFRGEIKQYEANPFEKIHKELNNPSDNSVEATCKFIGRFVYNMSDDAYKYSTGIVFGPNGARDLAGAGINQLELEDAGISTILNATPIKNFGKIANETKILNAAEFSSKYKGTEFLKGSAQERGIKIIQDNTLKKEIVKSSGVVDKSLVGTGVASQVKKDKE